MAQQPHGPHTVSLKVLRLSRPSLTDQSPLPPTHFGNGLDILPSASLAYSSAAEHSASATLTPLLALPSAFGAAYVGETFWCTLCANNEVREGDERSISALRVTAELQTPGIQAGTTLQLLAAADDDRPEDKQGGLLKAGATVQRTLQHELKEEGPHVLAVTVTYTETHGASDDRVRTFRKLYQFTAQQLIAVRSKITERKRREKDATRAWILEAQLENVGEAPVVLERVWAVGREGVRSRDVNGKETVTLKPGDVEQVMFVLAAEAGTPLEEGRIELAQVNIDWRSAMGEKGSLTTGWLSSRGR